MSKSKQPKNKNKRMEPRTLKGFNDYFAEDMKIREYVFSKFKKVFEKYGYEPLETPALEYTELMLGISGDEAEKQFYRFEDPGGRDVMLKFEVMTGMCRAVASNIHDIKFPYKRYQIQRVWRAENTQAGRLREFTQCDADTVGSDSMICDAEFIQMGLEVTEELGFEDYEARISNRKFLAGVAEVVGISDENFYGFCMSLDKLLKKGVEKVRKEMVEKREIPEEKVDEVLDYTATKQYKDKSFKDVLEIFRDILRDSEIGMEGLDELEEIDTYLRNANVDQGKYMFDTSLARGLAHYTGPIWEFVVKDGGVGSIGGCGRYDNLIGSYLGVDEQVPATGGSFGVERVCTILKDRKMVDFGKTTTDVLVTVFDDDTVYNSLKVADELRDQGVSVMLYPEEEKLGKQFKYADRKGIRWVVIIGPEEIENNVIALKNMKSGDQSQMSVSDAVDKILK